MTMNNNQNPGASAMPVVQKSGFIPVIPVPVGGVVLATTPITYNENRCTVKVEVRNTGDRPIQVGSHFHFFEVNRYLEFDRSKAFGYHLNIPATTAIRFEPGDAREVELVAFGGKRRIIGFNGLTNGYAGIENEPSYYPIRVRAIKRVKKFGFKCSGASADACECNPSECEPCECEGGAQGATKKP